MSGPEVSVVIPALDAADVLPVQLAALERQRVDFPWEAVVCDNGSTDGTSALVGRWRGRLPGLRLVDASARRGASAARNAGAAVARGGLLLFCDADDEVADGWLAAMREALGRAPLVAGARRYDRLNAAPFGPDDWVEPLFTLDYFPALPAASSNNLGVRKEVFDEVGGFDETLRTGEDVDLCWRVQLAGHTLAAEPRAVVDVRRRNGVRAVFRQSYGYGVGDRLLQHKYADLIARSRVVARAACADPPSESSASAPDGVGTKVRAVLSRLVRLRSPIDPTFAAARAGRWWGRRRAVVDTAVPRIAVPAGWDGDG